MGKWGTGTISQGARLITVNGEQVLEHRRVVEQVLGFKLPSTVIVHHIDENRLNNTKDNLVVCQDASYHRLIHQRMRALKACGNANYQCCIFCKEWDDPKNMYHNKAQYAHYHRPCRVKYRKEH